MAKKKIVRIPGVSFSWKRALGITQAKQKFARQTEIPTSKAGLERKLGKALLKVLFGKSISFSVYATEKALHWLDGCRSLGEP